MNQIFKALADPTRRKVLELLHRGPMTAGEIGEAFPVSRPTMSAHFNVLREAGLIAAHKDGKTIIYRLQLSVLEEALLGFGKIFRIGAEASATDLAQEGSSS